MTPISQKIWDMKYRLRGSDGKPIDMTIEDTWCRVAGALAANERESELWKSKFYNVMEDFRFIPAGRIVAGAGSGRRVTLFNCFVMGTIPDDMTGIFENLREAALTMQQGGGIGFDFSTLRPRGASVKGVGADASGPLSFMDVWDSMCRTIMSAGYRRGAMMATMRCDHPDIEDFISAKREPGRLRMFNLSVLVSDALMSAVKNDGPWELKFDGVVYKVVRARDLWTAIMRATYTYAEPGVIFIDRINRSNNLSYCEEITCTNPCGEQPLPPHGACLLGSVNLTRFVRSPFTASAEMDFSMLEEIVPIAVRMIDNAIDVSEFPLPQQTHEAMQKRRIGIGVTGLADALIMCGTRYNTDRAVKLAGDWMQCIKRAAYFASSELAREKGAFPMFECSSFLSSGGAEILDSDIKSSIELNGLRNGLLTSVAPTGTISLLADNVSSGIEPVFSYKYTRKVLMPDGDKQEEEVSDYAYRLFYKLFDSQTPLPESFVDVQNLSPHHHISMQAAVQKHVDSAVSKTVNCPEAINFEEFFDIYSKAYDLGCKGITTYRPNSVTGSVLETDRNVGGGAVVTKVSSDKSPSSSVDMHEEGGVIYMTRPLNRPEVLYGKTYKVRWPENDHAMYITVNDVVVESRRRPFEVFINSKNMEHYAWTVALTRMISAVFRRGGDVSFVVEELLAVFDPRGGHWVEGQYVPSILAAIGQVIRQHMIDIGFMSDSNKSDTEVEQLLMASVSDDGGFSSATRFCSRCNQPGIVRMENCDSCSICGYSRCT